MSTHDHSLVLIGSFTLCLSLWAMVSPAQVGRDKLLLCQSFAFSTEEDFVTRGPEPPDGSPIISAGDLLTSHPTAICARNEELLSAFDMTTEDDLGLDAVDVIDAVDYIVAFSTEIDDLADATGATRFTAGDLLITTGVVIRNAELTFNFSILHDIGLDAVQFMGEKRNILDLLMLFNDQGVPTGREFSEALASFGVDIWFSTEGTFQPSGSSGYILDGDLLSARDGIIVAKQADIFPITVPAGVPSRGVDFGLDAVAADRQGTADSMEFSPEILYTEDPLFVDGDALRYAGGVHMANRYLVDGFQPVTGELGLDALSGTLGALFADGFESGDVSRWSSSVP